MSTPKKIEAFLQETIKQVKFFPDRKAIKKELESHILDHMDDLSAQGEKNPEETAVIQMGDSKEVGKALNKEHNAVLGWTTMLAGIVVVLMMLPMVKSGADEFYSANIKDYSKDVENVVTHVKTDVVVPMDGEVIHYTDFMITEDNNLVIISKVKDAGVFSNKSSDEISVTKVDETLLNSVISKRNAHISYSIDTCSSINDGMWLEHILIDENGNEIFGGNTVTYGGKTRHSVETYLLGDNQIMEEITVAFKGYGDRNYQFTVDMTGGQL